MVSSVSPETEHTPAKVMTVSRESPATPVSDSSLLWRASEGPKSQAAVPVGGGRASPGFETTHQTTHQQPNATGAEGTGGTAGRKRPWLRCPWAAAGPRRASKRRTKPHISNQAPPAWRAPEGPEGARGHGCVARGRWQGLAGLRGDAPSEARGADGSRASRRPRAHQAARPSRRPEHQRCHSNTATGTTPTRPGIQKTDIRFPDVGLWWS